MDGSGDEEVSLVGSPGILLVRSKMRTAEVRPVFASEVVKAEGCGDTLLLGLVGASDGRAGLLSSVMGRGGQKHEFSGLLLTKAPRRPASRSGSRRCSSPALRVAHGGLPLSLERLDHLGAIVGVGENLDTSRARRAHRGGSWPSTSRFGRLANSSGGLGRQNRFRSSAIVDSPGMRAALMLGEAQICAVHRALRPAPGGPGISLAATKAFARRTRISRFRPRPEFLLGSVLAAAWFFRSARVSAGGRWVFLFELVVGSAGHGLLARGPEPWTERARRNLAGDLLTRVVIGEVA